jgi:hypothetical protein
MAGLGAALLEMEAQEQQILVAGEEERTAAQPVLAAPAS